MTDQPFLVVRDVEYFALNGNQLLHPISFTLAQGSVLAIAGPNGAGKSTLLNLISGLESLALGDVVLDGKSLRSMSAAMRAKRIAVVTQHSEPDGRLRLQDYVALGQMPIWSDRSADEHAKHLDQVLELTRLTGLAQNSMARLSGGERQRAHIARALAQRPQLLFLDEPTNHLDIRHQLEVLDLIRNLPLTIVTSLHDLNLAAGVCDDVLLIQSGQTVGFAPPAQVLSEAAVSDAFQVTARREQLSRSNTDHLTFHLQKLGTHT